MAHGKKYNDALKRYDREGQHGPAEAVDMVKSLASASFDETVELVARLGVDPRKADQIVRGTVALRPVPTSWVPTTWPPRSRAACSTSTWPSPRPT
jgi:ribosomal protein L1